MSVFTRSLAVFSLALLLAAPADAQEHKDHGPGGHSMDELFPPREASGTSWVPSITPMSGWSHSWRGWELMIDGRAFGQIVIESAEKHRTGGPDVVQPSSVNWGMLMARRPAAGARLGFRNMLRCRRRPYTSLAFTIPQYAEAGSSPSSRWRTSANRSFAPLGASH